MAKLATKAGPDDLPHPMENVKPDNWQDKFEVRLERGHCPDMDSHQLCRRAASSRSLLSAYGNPALYQKRD